MALETALPQKQVPTSTHPSPCEVGAHLQPDHGDSVGTPGPICGRVSNVVGCCQMHTSNAPSAMIPRRSVRLSSSEFGRSHSRLQQRPQLRNCSYALERTHLCHKIGCASLA